VTWSRFLGDPYVFALIGALLNVCGPLIIPAIVASKSAPNYMIEYGNQICSDFSDASVDHNGQIEHSTAANLGAKLENLTFFNHTLLSFPPPVNIDIHSGIERSAFDFATRAISIITSPIIPQSHRPQMLRVTKILADYASMLYIAMPEQIAMLRAHLHPVIRVALDEGVRMPSPAAGAWELMRIARSIQLCFAPGCPESVQSSGQVFMRCSGCRIVAYSGKSCQRRAWTYKPLPHRDICKKMAQVFNVGGRYLRREEDQENFVREMKKAKIDDLTLREITLWLQMSFTTLEWGSSHQSPVE
jgi:hypothetical protein